jgi:hypothetical protein
MKRFLAVAVLAVMSVSCAEPTNPTAQNALTPGAARMDVAVSSAGSVLPSAYVSVMGTLNNNFPHSQKNLRYQQVFLGTDITNPVIVGLCLRRDDILSPSPSRTQTLTVKLGPTTLDYTNLTGTFDANYSSPPVEVFTGDVEIPSSPGAGTPSDFDFCIPFTTEYDQPAGSNLIVEVVNTSLTSGFVPRDACAGDAPECTTSRAYAFSADATEAFSVERGGLVMKLVSPEPPAPVNPADKSECMKGGWSDFGFRNQGQCIRFIETGTDSRTADDSST